MGRFLRPGLGALALLLFTASAWAQDRRVLLGHVPRAVANLNLQPIGRLSGSTRLKLAIGLPLRNQEALTNLLRQIYDPGSPLYHQYLTPEQFAEKFGPTKEDYQAVIDFAKANGLQVTESHPNRMVLDVDGAAADVEKAFQVTMLEYQHPRETRTFHAPNTEPSVDSAVPILDISGLSDYSRPHPNYVLKPANLAPKVTPNAGSGPGNSYIGNDFRTAYVPGPSLTATGQTVALVQFDGYLASDIAAYEAQAGLPSVTLTNVLLDGFSGTPTGNGGEIEVSLDIEMVIAMAPGLSKVIVYEGNPNFFIPNDVLNRIATDNSARQISCSWTWSGGPSATTDQIFQQMATHGQSFFVASGDSDSYANGAVDSSTGFGYPAQSPYVTSVGGTTLTTTGPGGSYVSETVWNRRTWDSTRAAYVGSSGGSSGSYAIPTWQQGVSMSSNGGSTTKRNFPDVALIAEDVFVIADNGTQYQGVGGTSCAAPLWAGFTALVNQRGTANGLSPVGFLNPVIYRIGTGTTYTACFHDTTTGDNTSPDLRNPNGSTNQFYAVAGYDLCTGWGTPTGTNLINALAGSPTPLIVASGSTLFVESCTPTNSAIDPGETVTVNFSLQNTGSANTSNLVATLLATNGVTAPSGPKTYGALVARGAAVAQPFTFTANGACAGTITNTFQLQDGAINLGTVTFNFTLGAVVAATNTFSNTATIAIPSSGNASPYPSTITVSGMPGLINHVTVTITNLTHTNPDDIDILLVGPGGQSMILMSDAGGTPDISNVTLTFDDAAASSLPNNSTITSGTYKPSNFGSGTDTFSSPAPAGPYSSTLSVFNGQNPNGTWSLYVVDDLSPNSGSIGKGWMLKVTTTSNACCVGSVNHAPVIIAASISPASPTTTNDLVATVTSTNDPDGDPITFAYQWQQSTNNVAFTNLTGQTTGTLDAALTVAGDYYRVIITPNDGKTNGAPFTTASVLVPADADGNGINDDWEVQYFGHIGIDPNADPDGDGFSNLQEFLAGTDPTNAASALRITEIDADGDDVRIAWSAVGGKNYVVQTNAPSDDNFTNDFSDLSAMIAVLGSSETSTNYLDVGGAINTPARFYRIKLLP